eukprot:TRINITY_DN8180_c0_g1_i1.p1 TRINITY_DN8180_c0_g1~~TRINITY_DN8180_c0_g1_i1.p1  ORF type:complete len:116 (-),score=8.87 TRINITY_DN8180_c0_g1_i1:163-510(-)
MGAKISNQEGTLDDGKAQTLEFPNSSEPEQESSLNTNPNPSTIATKSPTLVDPRSPSIRRTPLRTKPKEHPGSPFVEVMMKRRQGRNLGTEEGKFKISLLSDDYGSTKEGAKFKV